MKSLLVDYLRIAFGAATRLPFGALVLLASGGVAVAAPAVSVEPATIHPGDPVLVTVTDATDVPHGKAGGVSLEFYRATGGYQAVFAVPLDVNEDHLLVEIGGGVKPLSIPIQHKKFAESHLVVEEEYADPPKEERAQIEADNRAIAAAYAKSTGAPQFTHAFLRPAGKVTSGFGEWRTFNDGHRAQHLGTDFVAREGSKVAAADDGTVALVRDTFLAGTVVVVAHGGGISSLYFHLSKATVAEGDRVKRGDEIGRAGHTGRTTGPHLHLSIHAGNAMVDPIAFLKLKLAPASEPSS